MTTDHATITEKNKKKILLFISFCLCLAIFSIYWQTLSHEFVYDDIWYVRDNPAVSQGLSLKGLRWAFALSEKESSYYHPLAWLSHMLDVQIYGLNPPGHHLTNIILQCLNTLLLFHLLTKLTGNIAASTIAALLFAVHPINIETVAWVAERKNLLSVFFGFCTIEAYRRYAKKTGTLRYLTVCLLFLCSLLAKPTLAILPLLLLLLDFWPLARLQPDKTWGKTLVTLGVEKIPLLLLGLALVLLASVSSSMYGIMVPFSGVSLQLRIANALVSTVKYIWKIFVPLGQSMFYPYPTAVPLTHWAGALLLLLFVTCWSLLQIKKRPYFFTGWLWFLIALLPVSGLLQNGLWPAMADRFAYFPTIGLFIIIGWTAESAYRAAGRRIRAFLSFTALAATLFFLTVSFLQIKTWQNPLTLFRQAIIHAPDSYVVNLNYANALYENGQIAKSIGYYQKAISLDPASAKAHCDLANAFVKQHRYAQAISHYRSGLELTPADDPLAGRIHFAIGGAYEKLGDLANATGEYFKAIQLNPDFAASYNSLGIILAEQGQVEEAITLFRKGLQLAPDDRIIRQNLEHAQKLLQKK